MTTDFVDALGGGRSPETEKDDFVDALGGVSQGPEIPPPETEQDFYSRLNKQLGFGERTAIMAGRGVDTVMRGVSPNKRPRDRHEQAAYAGLKEEYPWQSFVGEVAGETGALYPLYRGTGLLNNLSNRLATRVMTGAATGAAEGAIIARGNDFDKGDAVLAALIGGGLGGGTEIFLPLLGRWGHSLVRRVFGRKAQHPPFDAAGNPSPEVVQAADQAGVDLEEAAAQLAEEASQSPEVIAKFAGDQESQKVAREVMPDQRILSAAEEIGVEGDLLPSHYSTNQSYIDFEQGLKSGVSGDLAQREQALLAKMDDVVNRTVSEAGGNTDVALLDINVRSEMEDFTKATQEAAGKLFKQADATIPSTARTNPANTQSYLANAIESMGGIEEAGPLLSKLERTLMKLPEEPTYAALDRIRRDIGEGYRKRGPYADASTAELDAVYAALREDQMSVAAEFGVRDQLEEAFALTNTYKDFQQRQIQLFGTQLNKSLVSSLRSGVNALQRGDLVKINNIMEQVPENLRREVAATALTFLFTSNQRGGGPLSQGFVKAFESLQKSPKSLDVLFRHLEPEAKRRFMNIGRVATGIFKAKSRENTSGTFRAIASAMEDGSLVGKIYGVGKDVARAESVTSTMGAPGMGSAAVLYGAVKSAPTPKTQAADELLASSEFRNAVLNANDPKAQANLLRSEKFLRWLEFHPEHRQPIQAAGFAAWLGAREDEDG